MRKRQSTGFFSTISRKSGNVLVYRWQGRGPDGTPRKHKRVLGWAKDFRSQAAAWREVKRLGLGQRMEGAPCNFQNLADHWLETECPKDDVDPNGRRAFSTRDNYRSYLRKWILPQWGSFALEEIKAVAVERWLSTLNLESGYPLAPGTKKKIRDVMHLIYEHSIRWEWMDRNPLSAVRQGGQRQSTPRRLSLSELSILIYHALEQRERVMTLLDFGAGLRRGELAGLKWDDIDFVEKTLMPKRSIVKQRVGPVKTKKSMAPMPLADHLITELLAWRRETPYAGDSDYIFASPKKKGTQPYWMSRIMQYHIKPAAAKAGIVIEGWHTLRRSYTTLLRQNNDDPKVVQALLRHSSIKMTLDIYDEAVSEEKQIAHQKVVDLLVQEQSRTAKRTAAEIGSL
jgi:integrase